jgi:hypothetical protein
MQYISAEREGRTEQASVLRILGAVLHFSPEELANVGAVRAASSHEGNHNQRIEPSGSSSSGSSASGSSGANATTASTSGSAAESSTASETKPPNYARSSTLDGHLFTTAPPLASTSGVDTSLTSTDVAGASIPAAASMSSGGRSGIDGGSSVGGSGRVRVGVGVSLPAATSAGMPSRRAAGTRVQGGRPKGLGGWFASVLGIGDDDAADADDDAPALYA